MKIERAAVLALTDDDGAPGRPATLVGCWVYLYGAKAVMPDRVMALYPPVKTIKGAHDYLADHGVTLGLGWITAPTTLGGQRRQWFATLGGDFVALGRLAAQRGGVQRVSSRRAFAVRRNGLSG